LEECLNELNQSWHLYYCERRWETTNSWTRDNHNNVMLFKNKKPQRRHEYSI
jgi:hypothetical protein